MKIIDIMKQSAGLLGLANEVSILSSTTQENVSTSLQNDNISQLYSLGKLSVQQLCTDYVPIINESQITTNDKKYSLSSLTNYVRFKELRDIDNKLVPFKIINRKIVVENDGMYTAIYFTYPEINSVFDEAEYLASLSPDVIVFSVCAYFSLTNGLFTEFREFYDKYVERAESIKELKIFSLPARRWE